MRGAWGFVLSCIGGFNFLPSRKRDKAGATRAVRRSCGFVYRSNQMWTEGLQVDPLCRRLVPHEMLANCKAPFAFLFCRRFFGNRSYCYYCLEQYPEALTDAERAIQLAPDWPKGHFRQGRALMGMKVSEIPPQQRKIFAERSEQISFVRLSGTARRSGPWSRCWGWTRTARRPSWISWTAKCCS